VRTERVIGAKIIKVKQRQRWSRLEPGKVYDVLEIVLDNGMKIVPWSVLTDGPPIIAMRPVRISSKFGREFLEQHRKKQLEKIGGRHE
tara:strand:+ start:223 stop:486 length:264 start_codon:yes stop_codon:yes gene_type:complete